MDSLALTLSQWEEMRRQMEAAGSVEACGLLAGTQARVASVIPIHNELNSPVRFRFEPLEQLRAFESIDNNGWEVLAIYHSHPKGPPHPSPADIAEAFYEVAYIIWMPVKEQWQARAYWIENGTYSEITLEIRM